MLRRVPRSQTCPASGLLLWLCGCLPVSSELALDPDASVPSRDASAAAGIELVALDARGLAWPVDALPRRFTLEVEGAWSPEGRPAIFLFEGRPDSALLADLAGWPLLVANQARRVATTSARTPLGERVVVESPLVPGGRYTLGVGAWALGHDGKPRTEARVFDLSVAIAEAGAIVVETWPAAGTYGVPPMTPFLAVRFDDVVEGVDGIRVETDAGLRIDGATRKEPCEELALSHGECVVFTPANPLPEETVLRIEVSDAVVDRTGASVGPFTAELRTGAPGETSEPPRLEALGCSLDELPVDGACALRFDRSIRLRARASSPVRARLVAGSASLATSAPRGDFSFDVVGLEPGATVTLSLTLFGLDGATARADWTLRTESSLSPIFITEVRADPAGPEPAQEYVEVHNASDAPVDLTGFRITDDDMRAGDAIASPAVLPARGYALLVPAGFDPDGPGDDPVPPGTPLFRADASLGSGGLANQGEPLYLRDASGRRISAAPARPAPAEGVCIVRAVADGRTGDLDAFLSHPEGRCGPGRADSVAP